MYSLYGGGAITMCLLTGRVGLQEVPVSKGPAVLLSFSLCTFF